MAGYIDEGERERMAHGDELGGALGGLDAGDPGDFEGIALGVFREGFDARLSRGMTKARGDGSRRVAGLAVTSTMRAWPDAS